mgnify:CR=1 FL=1
MYNKPRLALTQISLEDKWTERIQKVYRNKEQDILQSPNLECIYKNGSFTYKGLLWVLEKLRNTLIRETHKALGGGY